MATSHSQSATPIVQLFNSVASPMPPLFIIGYLFLIVLFLTAFFTIKHWPYYNRQPNGTPTSPTTPRTLAPLTFTPRRRVPIRRDRRPIQTLNSLMPQVETVLHIHADPETPSTSQLPTLETTRSAGPIVLESDSVYPQSDSAFPQSTTNMV